MDRFITLKPNKRLDDGLLICDITNQIECKDSEIALRDLSFNTPNMCKDFMFVFVYCDVIQPEYVGDTLSNMLVVSPIKKEKSQFIQPTQNFHVMSKDIIYDHIKFMLRDEYGRNINTGMNDFEVTLQLRHSR